MGNYDGKNIELIEYNIRKFLYVSIRVLSKALTKVRTKKGYLMVTFNLCICYVSDTVLVTVPFFTSNSTIFKLNFNGNL